ncbi:hypothetical protein R5R35_011028 [Gryllus longicercus]|uniref:C2H2-type domain-containing protein n=1 Tax=Gryllus longicercus TaxID=2509291 RepID=A0AAN9VDP3_9ORTH
MNTYPQNLKVKEEPDDNIEDYSWNTDEELENPASVFLKTETVCEIEEEFQDEETRKQAFQESDASEDEEEVVGPRAPVVFEPIMKEEEDNDSKPKKVSLTPGGESGFLTSIRQKLGALLPGEETYKSPTLEGHSPGEETYDSPTFLEGLSPDYICDCGERPGSEKAAMAHVDSHAGAKPFRCLICKKHFSTKGIAVLHMKIHFGDKPNKYVFRRNFRQKNDLFPGKDIQCGENPMECYVCKKNFTEIGELIAHVRIHTGGRPYECDVCEKIFWQKYNFFEHMRIHTGEKPFECNVCNKNFARRGNLIVHMRIHTGEKPFQCRVCKKKFTRCSGLKSHQLTHNRKNSS